MFLLSFSQLQHEFDEAEDNNYFEWRDSFESIFQRRPQVVPDFEKLRDFRQATSNYTESLRFTNLLKIMLCGTMKFT